jgi:hypothetical protein
MSVARGRPPSLEHQHGRLSGGTRKQRDTWLDRLRQPNFFSHGQDPKENKAAGDPWLQSLTDAQAPVIIYIQTIEAGRIAKTYHLEGRLSALGQ